MNQRFVLIAGIAAGICCLSPSCAPEAGKTLPVVDVIGAINREKTLKMSDIVESIQYVKLETTPECLLGDGGTVKYADHLYISNRRPPGILVFDRKGKFLRQIGRQGQGPGEYMNFAYFDVSPNNQLLALGGFGEISLYAATGEFLRRARLDNGFPFLSGFLFLDDRRLITYNARMNATLERNPAMLAWDTENLRADTILWLNQKVTESDLMIPFAYTPFYPWRNSICFMKAANDTLYELNGDLGMSPRMIFDCGSLSLKEENLFKTTGKLSIKPWPLMETRGFLFAGISKGDEYGILAFDKKSQEAFRLPEWTSHLDGQSIQYGPENDLDGLDFSLNGSKINEQVWCSALQIADLKNFFEKNPPVETHNYASLQQLTEASDLNDNPIIRIIHWK